jgi:hypothetical protein
MSCIARYYDILVNFSARFAPIATKVECRSERVESKLSRDFAARGGATARLQAGEPRAPSMAAQ